MVCQEKRLRNSAVEETVDHINFKFSSCEDERRNLQNRLITKKTKLNHHFHFQNILKDVSIKTLTVVIYV